MPYTVIYFLIPSLLNKSLKSEIQRNSVVIGALTPLLMHDLLYDFLSHSIFLPAIIFLLFEVLSIISSRDSISSIGKGLAIGLFIHLLIDLFLYSKDINFLWPIIEIPQSSQTIITKHYIEMNLLLLSLEFIGFRYIFWSMLKSSIRSKNKEYYIIFFINFFYKLSLYLFTLILLIGLLLESPTNLFIELIRYSFIFSIVALLIVITLFNSPSHKDYK